MLRHVRPNVDRSEIIIPSATVALALKMPLDLMTLECKDGQWSIAGINFTVKFPDLGTPSWGSDRV